ncbi:CatB-related O-acetyltransferase [Microbulbifer sp. JMSA008]|uniref:CatB-related O-acetyltransferase n=1 Tax=unclassified Microbulbifer TaxID=2619833 RepID=UPI00403A97A3
MTHSKALLLEKLENFLSELPSLPNSFSIPIRSRDCAKNGVKRSNAPKYAFFEESIRLNSPVLEGQYKSFIGAHSYMGDGGYIKQSFIGRYCSIGRRVSIGPGSHVMTNLTTSPNLSKKELKKPTVLENDVWVGDGAVILPGVRVNLGAVIGANAVVTKDVKSFSVVGGAPARHIKYRVDPSLFTSIIESCWWEFSKEILVEMKNLEIQDRLNVLKAFNIKDYKNYETFRLI